MGENSLGQTIAKMQSALEKQEAKMVEKIEVPTKDTVRTFPGFEEMGLKLENKKPKLLFLDDRSKRLHAALRKYGDQYDVTLVCTAKECIKMLSNEGPWDVVSLDHDLDFDEFADPAGKNTGMEVVRWVMDHVEYLMLSKKNLPVFVLHSSNRAAAWKMAECLTRAIGQHKLPHRNVSIEGFSYDD